MESSVPRSVPNSAVNAAVETVEDVVDQVEEIFLPRPDGIVSRHRAERVRREAMEKERENESNRVEEHSYKAVKTSELMPEIFSTNVASIPPGGYAMVLPLNEYRYRATLELVQQFTTVTVATPAFPGSAAAIQNPYPFPVTVVISGGTATATTVNGQLVGPGDGTYIVPAAGSISVTYSVAPTWAWSVAYPGANVIPNTGLNVILAKDSGQALSGTGLPLLAGIPLPVNSRAQLFAFNPNSVLVQVVTLSELNAPEKYIA